MSQLAAVSYVGKVALTDIKNYIPAWLGQQPDPPAPDGSVEYGGFTFSPDQVTKLITFINNPTLTFAELDGIQYVGPTQATGVMDYLQAGNTIDTIAELVDASDDAGASSLAGHQVSSIAGYASTWTAPSSSSSYEPIVICGIAFSAGEVEKALDLVNNATLAQLDDSVGLTSTAARNIVAARPIGSMQALDSVAYVATQVFQRVKAYLPTWTLSGSSGSGSGSGSTGQGGTYEGVAFTDDEAAKALDIANNATFDQLRYEATLTSRASNNVVSARPIASMEELALVSYVGTAALTDIKYYIPTWTSGATTPSGGAGETHEGVAFTTVEAETALDIANNASYDQLRNEATLTSTAANNIMAARPIATMGDLAAVSYVGTAAMTDIKNYIPSWSGGSSSGGGGDGGGTYEGVAFTESEVTLALDIANNASYDQLRNEATLTSTAANNLMAARPIATMDDLAAVPYVGTAAMTDIKNYIPSWTPTPPVISQGGTYEGVVFSDDEARTALQIVNTATFDQLRYDATLTSTAVNNIIAARTIATMEELTLVSYVGAAAMTDIKNYISAWPGGPVDPPAKKTVQELFAEAQAHDAGTPSDLYDKVVEVSRAIVTSDPYTHSSGPVSFWVADPHAGNVEQLKVYITSSTGLDTSFASIFDDVAVMGKFTKYNTTWELVLDTAGDHSISRNTSGVKYESYETIQDAWRSTSANPEGAVRLVSDFGYTYMVPMPVFLDHPMWNGNPPGLPSDAQGRDTNWIINAQNTLNAWRAGGQQQPEPPAPRLVERELLFNPDDRSGGGGSEVWFDALRYSLVVPAGDNATQGTYAMTVKQTLEGETTVVPWSIDGEGEGWMLMIGGRVVLWGGISRDRIYNGRAEYTVSYYTTDPEPAYEPPVVTLQQKQTFVSQLLGAAYNPSRVDRHYQELLFLAADEQLQSPPADWGIDPLPPAPNDKIVLKITEDRYWGHLPSTWAEGLPLLEGNYYITAPDPLDINGDGYSDVIVGAGNAASGMGQVYIFFGPIPVRQSREPGDELIGALDADVVLTGVGGCFGFTVASAGDVNGDGYADVIAGGYGAGAYIFFGGPGLLEPTPTKSAADADVTLTGVNGADRFGICAAGAGDVNGDGYADVIVGAYAAAANLGQAYIFYGSASLAGTVSASSANVTLTGIGSKFGKAVAGAGDMNGDGYADTIVGADRAAGVSGAESGEAYIFFGSNAPAAAISAGSADVTLKGSARYAYFGGSVATAGDVNGDGYADVIVGKNESESVGWAYVFFGKATLPATIVTDSADMKLTGAGSQGYFGWSVGGTGDINGDGYAEVIVGAVGANDEKGAAYVFFGSASPSADPISGSNANITLNGYLRGDWLGSSVAGAGDLNRDGYADILVGASGVAGEVGEAYILYGSASPARSTVSSWGDVVLTGHARPDNFGRAVGQAAP
ncbi:FG-GAP-like repeat-containing protein [Planctomycetota bacterium]